MDNPGAFLDGSAHHRTQEARPGSNGWTARARDGNGQDQTSSMKQVARQRMSLLPPACLWCLRPTNERLGAAHPSALLSCPVPNAHVRG
eukprot:scaffold1758_cov333-Pavlova_lutheri.AAC.15